MRRRRKYLYFDRRQYLCLISFEKLKEKYTLGSVIELRIVVKENAELMRPSSIKVNVHAPIVGKVLSIPRKGLALYSLTFTETEKEGKYTFTIEKSENYEAIEYQQSVSVMPLFVFPWRLFIILVATFIVIVGLTAAAIKLKVWILARKSHLLIEEFHKKTQPEIIKDVGTTFAMPDEILLWEDFVAVEQIYFFKQDGNYSIICAVGNDVILNDVAISGGKKIILNDGDTIRAGGLGLKVEMPENMPEKVSLYYLDNVMIRVYRKTDKVRWLVKNISTQPLQVGNIIPLNFVKGNILYVGQDEGLYTAEPND
ncbi:MAG: hypothetical protein ACE5KJ_07995, partial [Candidatus Zixiibacteriota bacterium]